MRSKLAYPMALVFFACVPPVSSTKKSEPPALPKAVETPAPKEAPEALPEGDAEEGPIAVEAGEFWMGAETPDKTHAAKHKVALDGFEIDRYEVTAGEYAGCV